MATWKRVITPLMGDPDIYMFDLNTNTAPGYSRLPTTILTNNMLSSGQHYRNDTYDSSITIENQSDYIIGAIGSETAIIYPNSSTTFYGNSEGAEVYLTAALRGGGVAMPA